MVLVTHHYSAGSKSKAIVSSTNATPIVVALASGHGFVVGEHVTIAGHATNTNANADWIVSAKDATHITLVNESTGANSVGNGVGGATGTVGRKYATIHAWEADTDIDLVAGDVVHYLHLYQDSPTDFTYPAASAALVMAGATVNSTHYRVLTYGVGHRWDPVTLTGAKITRTMSAGLGTGIQIAEDFFRFIGVGVEVLDGGVTSGSYLGVEVIALSCQITSIWSKYAVGSGTCDISCFQNYGGGSGVVFANCIAVGSNDETLGAQNGFEILAGTTASFYHCASYGCKNTIGGTLPTFGIKTVTGCTIVNCEAIDNVSSVAGSEDIHVAGTTVANYCVTGDATATTAPNTNGFSNEEAAKAWIYAAADDFRNQQTARGVDTALKLTAPAAVLSDFAGTVRTNSWDIGPYDGVIVQAFTEPTIVIHSIGTRLGRDFATITDWEIFTRKHLIALNVRYIGELYDDTTFALAGTTQVISGAVTDATRYRMLRNAVDPTTGQLGASTQRYNPIDAIGALITSTAAITLDIRDRFFRLEGVGVKNTRTGAGTIALKLSGASQSLDGCFIEMLATNTGTGAKCVSSSGADAQITNCIAHGTSGAGAQHGFYASGPRALVANCDTWKIGGPGSIGIGIETTDATSTIINCAAIDSDATDFATVGVDDDYNASSDSSAPGPHSQTGRTSAVWNSAAGNDYRLVFNSPLLNKGTNLAQFFSTDFAGSPRTGLWEIGAYNGFVAPPLSFPKGSGESNRRAYCFKIERTDGFSYTVTDHSSSLVHAGEVYDPIGGVGATARRKEGALRDANVALDGFFKSAYVTKADLLAKRFHDAKVTEYRIDWKYPFTAPLMTTVFYITAVSHTSEGWNAETSGFTRLIQRRRGAQMARVCNAVLGDSRCKFDVRAHSQLNQTVTSVAPASARYLFKASGVDGAFLESDFKFGKILWLTGNLAGLSSEIKSYDQSTREFEVQFKLPTAVQVGDTFDALIGCSGLFSRCFELANVPNFRGNLFFPGTDRILAGPMQ